MINILVAENAKLLSNIISTELKKNNYNCTQVFSLKEIEYEVSIQNYDYIILNLYLPDAEEKDLIINVKKITTSKIIVLTSKDNDELRDYLFKYGIIDYLNKENIEQTIKNIDKLITHIEKNNKSNILINGICRTLVPVRPRCFLVRWKYMHASVKTIQIPRLAISNILV